MNSITEQTNKFNLNYEELIYSISQLNGVIPTINLEERWESIIVNILAGAEFEPIPEGLPEKLKALNFWQRVELYAMIRNFWDAENYSIQDTKARLSEVGLWSKN